MHLAYPLFVMRRAIAVITDYQISEKLILCHLMTIAPEYRLFMSHEVNDA